MNKKIIALLILIVVFLTAGCSNREVTKVINLEYIKSNSGIKFGKYAIAIDSESNKKEQYAIFKEKSVDRYKKVFNIDEYSKKDKLLATDKILYIFYNDGGFVGYKLDSSLKKVTKYESDFKNIDGLIYYPIEVFGFNDDYIYISYYKDDSKKEILFAKVKYDLSEYISITEKDIPKDVKNNIEK